MNFQNIGPPNSFILVMIVVLLGCAGAAGTHKPSDEEFFEPVKSVPPAHGRTMLTPQHNQADSLLQVRIDSLLAKIREQEFRISELTARLQSRQSPQPLVQTGKPLQSYQSPQPSSHADKLLAYEQATGLFQQRNYKEAIATFQQLLDRGIEEELADNCRFWIGMSYYNLKDYNTAVEEFLKVLKYRGSNKADGAYFMLGQSYERLGSKPKAKEMFETVVREFPTGVLARDAKRKLDNLK